MKYVKPEFVVEEFALNSAVAACEKDLDKTVTTFKPQTVKCSFSEDNENVWALDTDGCERVALAIDYFDGSMTATQIESALKATIPSVTASGGHNGGNSSGNGGNNESTLAAGYYVYLVDGSGNDCVALATPGVLEYYTNSY